MKNIILSLLIFGSLSARAEARSHRPFHCFYVTSNKTGQVSSSCYTTRATCSFQLGVTAKQLKVKHPEACFVSRETESFSIPTRYTTPAREVLPNHASCLEAFRVHQLAGDAPTLCHPTESR